MLTLNRQENIFQYDKSNSQTLMGIYKLPRELVKSTDFEVVGLGRSLRFCFPHEFPGDAGAPASWITFQTASMAQNKSSESSKALTSLGVGFFNCKGRKCIHEEILMKWI